MESFVEDLLDEIASIGGGWLLLAAFLLAFAETALFADLIVPGEVGLIVAGAAAARGDDPHLAPLIVAAAIGATLGDSAGWLLGRTVGTDFVERHDWTPPAARAEGRASSRVLHPPGCCGRVPRPIHRHARAPWSRSSRG